MSKSLESRGGGGGVPPAGGGSQYLFYLSTVSGTIGSRAMSFDWAPRWLEPYYSDDSLFKKWYNVAVVSPRFALKDIGEYIVPKFYGPVSTPRLGWVAKYTFPKYHIPEIVLVTTDTNAVSGSVFQTRNTGTFLFERLVPIALYDLENSGTVRLRNLASVRFTNIPGQGRIELGYLFDDHPILEDSILTLIDPWGDTYFYDLTDERFDGRGIYIEKGGLFTVQYISKKLIGQLLNGTSYITIDGEKVQLAPYDVHNVWDETAWIEGTDRRVNETNRSLKLRCQQLPFLSKSVDRISSQLGQSLYSFWDTHFTSLNLQASGATSVSIIDQPQVTYFREVPNKEGGVFRLTHTPSGYVQLFYGNKSVSTDSYAVSGNLIIPVDSDRLTQAMTGTLEAHYTSNRFYTTESGDFITYLNTIEMERNLLTVIVSKNVKVSSSTKKINEWRWNQDYGVDSGEATFD